MSLTRLEINTAKSLAKGITPLKKKAELLKKKAKKMMIQTEAELEEIGVEIHKIEETILRVTNGISIDEIEQLGGQPVTMEDFQTDAVEVDEKAEIEMEEVK